MNLNQETTTIGYIGLGIMGRPAALNLIAGGWTVGVYARRAESLPPLVSAGAQMYPSPAALAEVCQVLITNVSDTPDVEQLLTGDNGVIHGVQKSAVIIDMSTIAPAVSRRLAENFSKKGAFMLDAPVSGGEKGAIDGTLTFMVGGDIGAFEQVKPILATMGKTITHIGAAGAGQVAKACNQIIIGATLSAIAESFRLARASGVDCAKVRESLLGGFAQSRVLEIHAERIIKNSYAPGFKSALHAKDINIAINEAKSYGILLPSAKLFSARLEKLLAAGGGELDSSAIATILETEE